MHSKIQTNNSGKQEIFLKNTILHTFNTPNNQLVLLTFFAFENPIFSLNLALYNLEYA